MVFSAPDPTAGCDSATDFYRLYWVQLEADSGMPLSDASEIDAINGYFNMAQLYTPALTPDLCTLYFSAQSDSDTDIFLARRR
jgi:hypothetical protein